MEEKFECWNEKFENVICCIVELYCEVYSEIEIKTLLVCLMHQPIFTENRVLS